LSISLVIIISGFVMKYLFINRTVSAAPYLLLCVGRGSRTAGPADWPDDVMWLWLVCWPAHAVHVRALDY
jgi:hypothetical protein